MMSTEATVAKRVGRDLPSQHKYRGLWAQAARRFVRNPSGMVGLVILSVMLTLHLGAPLFTDKDPTAMSAEEIFQPPSAEHLFGTDLFGRDVLSRVLYGGRISLLVATVVAVVTTITGVFFGALTGYYPRIDGPIMRAMDIVMAFPVLILALAAVAIMGPNLSNVIIALIIPVTPRTARVVRASFLALKEHEFVLAARSIGAKDRRIMFRHLLPNAAPTLLIRQTYIFGVAILIEGGLSFLGVGVQPEIATLGSVVADGRRYLRENPWVSLYAGLFIALLVLGINLLGDGLRDVLDPRMKR